MYPILVDLYGFEIRSFEVMLLVAWAMGLSLAVQQAKTEGLDGSMMSVCWFWGLIGAVVSARLPDLLSSPPATYDGPVLMQFLERLQHSRSSSLSGLLGAAVTGTGILFFHRQAILRYADAAVPGIFILLAMCRLGCFLNGCCFGVPTQGWWGCWFHPNSAAGIYAASLGDVRLVPTQLLLASGNLAVSILAVFLRASMQAPGTKCCVMMFLYAGLRTIVAVWRAPHFFVGEQTDIGQDQIVWIAIGAGSIVLMIFMRDRNGIKSV